MAAHIKATYNPTFSFHVSEVTVRSNNTFKMDMVRTWAESASVILLIGRTGCGKSKLIQDLSNTLRYPKAAKPNGGELKALRKEVQHSSSDVQRYLNLGWIGVCEVLN